MEKFCAEQFYGIACSIEELKCRFKEIKTVEGEHVANFATYFNNIGEDCGKIGLLHSRKAAQRAASDMTGNPTEQIKFHLRALTDLIKSEMEEHLFFWVPLTRAEFYGMTGRIILGDQCVDRFSQSGISTEVEHAARCFALGQNTACAFHLMRVCEAGVRALALALGYQWEANPNWGKFFKQYDVQLGTNPTKHVEPWISHADFLEAAGGNLRAAKDAWRNDTMHLEKSYDEREARHLLTVIPSFMRQIASRIDESGIFL